MERNILLELLKLRHGGGYGGARAQPPGAPMFNNVPSISGYFNPEDMGDNQPKYSAGVNVPFGGGSVGVSGSHFQPSPQSPVDWSAFLNYRRQF